MISLRFTCVLVAVLFLASSGATAQSSPASITALSGKVLVKRGTGIEAAQKGLKIVNGETIMVGENGEALLTQGDCNIVLPSTAVFTVRETPPCAAGEAHYVHEAMFIQPTNSTIDAASLPGELSNTATATEPFAPVVAPVALGNALIGTGSFSASMLAAATQTFILEDPVTPESN